MTVENSVRRRASERLDDLETGFMANMELKGGAVIERNVEGIKNRCLGLWANEMDGSGSIAEDSDHKAYGMISLISELLFERKVDLPY